MSKPLRVLIVEDSEEDALLKETGIDLKYIMENTGFYKSVNLFP